MSVLLVHSCVFFLNQPQKSWGGGRLCCLLSCLPSLLGTLAQLQSSVERQCPGESVTFTCTIPSNGHQWNIPSLNITYELVRRDQGRVITNHPPFQFNVTELMTGSITSTATVTATVDLNGTVVVCRDGIGMETEQHSTIKLSGELCLHAYKDLFVVSPVSIYLNSFASKSASYTYVTCIFLSHYHIKSVVWLHFC